MTGSSNRPHHTRRIALWGSVACDCQDDVDGYKHPDILAALAAARAARFEFGEKGEAR